jgi:3-oxoadipate enol-lactonase
MKLAVNGIRINIRERGKGTPSIVFLHYWGGSSRTWDGVIAELSEHHRCIATDHRGWGESDAPDTGYRLADLADDAQGVIEALKLDHYLVVGHSMGGKTAQLLAARRPVGLRGLALVAPSPPSPTTLAPDQREALLHAYDSRESIAYVIDHILTALPLPEAQREQLIADSLRGAPQAKHAWPTSMMLEDIRSEVARINVPTLVLAGERDQVDTTMVLRAELLPHITGARLQVLSGAGHLSMLETPQLVAQAIEHFIAKL